MNKFRNNEGVWSELNVCDMNPNGLSHLKHVDICNDVNAHLQTQRIAGGTLKLLFCVMGL